MKPNFALSLSFEGIGLLYRAFPGWNRVGEVALDSPDLPGALAVLRETALQINGQDLTSKLVIPNDQIKYLSLDLGVTTEDERDRAIHEALDGATPYPVDDLAFDWSVDGKTTQVAAVARETLAEAESFASDHGFGPICFVAIPPEGKFSGEPFFGPTRYAGAFLGDPDQVQRDMAPIRITGVVRLPDPGDDQDETEAVEAASDTDHSTAAPAPDNIPPDAPETDKPAPADPEARDDPADESATPEAAAPDDTTPDAAHAETPGSPDADTMAPEEPSDSPEASSEQGSLSVLADTLPGVDDDAQAPMPLADEEPGAPAAAAPEPAEDTADGTSLPAPESVAAEDDADSDADDPAESSDTATQDDEPAFSTIRAHRGDDVLPAAAPALSGVRRAESGLAAPSIPIPDDDFDTQAAPIIEATPEAYDDHDALSTIPPAPADWPLEAAQAPEPHPGFEAAEPGEDADTSEAMPQTSRLSVFRHRGTEMAAGLASGMRSSLAARSARRAEAREAEAEADARNVESGQVDPQGDVLVDERDRMTVFGARKAEREKREIGGKPRYLGLILTAVLLLFLAGVAAWASIFMDEGLSRFFGPRDREIVTLPADAVDEMIVEGEEAMVPSPPEDAVETASLAAQTDSGAEDLAPPPLVQPALPHALTDKEAQARYAVTGVWQRAPTAPQLPDQLTLEDLYITSIDTGINALDAVALPESGGFDNDVALSRAPLPPKRGARYVLDDRGLVVARAEGALSPEGFLVFAGRPVATPAALPSREPGASPALDDARQNLAGKRPRARPEGLVEQSERVNLGGLTRSELADKRPRARPASAQQLAAAKRAQEAQEAQEAADAAARAAAVDSAVAEAATLAYAEPASAQAVAQSRKPKPRPRNFSRVVDRARKAQGEPGEVTKVAAAVPRQQKVAPSVPSKTSVAKAATVRNQINLRRINLIGVYGKPSSRRALVRLSSGRYKKVKVGDRLDGGRVSSISDAELRYKKNGRNVILKMPRG